MSSTAGGENDSFIHASNENPASRCFRYDSDETVVSSESPPISSPAISLHSRFFYIMGREGMEELGEEVLHYYWLEAMKE